MRKHFIKVKFLTDSEKKSMEKKLAFRQRLTRIMMAMAKVMAPRRLSKVERFFFDLYAKVMLVLILKEGFPGIE